MLTAYTFTFTDDNSIEFTNELLEEGYEIVEEDDDIIWEV